MVWKIPSRQENDYALTYGTSIYQCPVMFSFIFLRVEFQNKFYKGSGYKFTKMLKYGVTQTHRSYMS